MTKNADLPAMPYTTWDNEVNEVISQGNGLTKREQFAAMAMQGLLASIGGHDVTDYAELASDAVTAADILLAELERDQ